IEMRDALGQVTRFEYDAAQRMTAMHTPEGTTTYRYDALGHLLAVAAPGSAPITYEYDEQDRLVREIQQNGEIRRDYPDNQSVSRTVLTDEQ
ncbi:RHS repeat protein, partial [Xenorhabdus bovienii]